MGSEEAAPPVYDEKAPATSRQDAALTREGLKNLKSPGVDRVEAISSVLTLYDRIAIFFSVFIVAYVYSLDGTLRFTFQGYATGEFNSHSLSSTLNIIRAVIGAAAQPTAGKIADVFGRIELICASVVFYVVGTIISASAKSVASIAGGVAIYQIGYTMIMLLVEVTIADLTSTRSRLFFSYLPALPFIINTWASGYIATDIMKRASWRWGYGMWCIIYPVCTIPLIVSLLIPSWRAKKQGLLKPRVSAWREQGLAKYMVELFWLLDVVGIILVIAVFALLLVPLTLAGGVTSSWKTAHVIAPLVIGFLCLPVFVFWELYAPHPLVPFRLMKDRGVWAALGIAVMLNFAWYLQGDFLYTVLIVAFDFDINMATRVSSLYSFCSVIAGPLIGLAVYKVRRLKYFIIFGTALFMVAFGLLIHFRGNTDGKSAKVGVIAAEVILGVAGGLFPYPAQASLQVNLKHENLAVMTGIFLALYNVGSALGNCVSGAIWTQLLPRALERNLENQTLAIAVYGDPLVIAPTYLIGTPERTGIIHAYRDTQRILVITGLCLCVPLIGFALALRNPKLSKEQTLAKESDSETEDGNSVAHA